MNQILVPVIGWVPSLVGALLILLIGWIVALLVSGAVRAVLTRAKLGSRAAGWMGREPSDPAAANAPTWISRAVFWLIMLFVLLAFFQALGLTIVAQPLNNLLVVIAAYIPQLVGALILLVLAWIIATVLRMLVTRGLKAARVDERLSSQAGAPVSPSLAETLGEVVYWLVFLLFLPAILGALNLGGLLVPVQTLLNTVLGFLPNVLAAALILLVGVFVAGIVRRIVTGLLAATGVDRLGARLGLGRAEGTLQLSSLIGLLVYILILVPVILAALNALHLDAVTRPISDMMTQMLAALPNIFAAALLLIIAYAVGRLVAGLVTSLLAGAGFDTLPVRLGLRGLTGTRWSTIAGNLVLALIMVGATMEAAQILGFAALTALLADLLAFASRVLLGLIILAFGLWLANMASRAVMASGSKQSGLFAWIARVGILLLAGAMALRAMGLANEIVNLAFGLLLGAVAVAAALAFGLGGREIAARELQKWVDDARRGGLPGPSVPPPPGPSLSGGPGGPIEPDLPTRPTQPPPPPPPIRPSPGGSRP